MLKKILIRFIAGFIPNKNKRRIFRKKYFRNYVIDADLENNNIEIPHNRNIKVQIDGINNTVYIENSLDDVPSNIYIYIYIHGNNNNVYIKTTKHINLRLNIGYSDFRQCDKSEFIIENGTYINGLNALIIENNSSIKIGSNNMFSFNIEMRCTDDHTVLDDDNNVLNIAKSIEIGNHVWICKDVLILKNTTIPDGCIVGARAVVSGKRFTEPNCAICGNPVKVVKEHVHWDEQRPDLYKTIK